MAKELDRVLHGMRAEPARVPQLIRGKRRIEFHMDGYGSPTPRGRGIVTVLTPALTLAVMAAGFSRCCIEAHSARRNVQADGDPDQFV